MLQWAGLNFAFGLFGPVAVSNAAHAGGFIGGGLAALALAYPTSPGRLIDPRRMAGILASLTLICLAIGIGRATSVTWLAISDPTAFEARQSDDLLTKSDAMLALNPADGQTLVQRAEVRANKGDYDGALDDIEKAVAARRDSQDIQRFRARLYAARGRAFAQKGDYAAALADTDKAITGGMDSPALHRIKGALLSLLGRNEDALPEIEIALRDNPRDAVALNIRAHLHEAMGNREQAIADYQAALKLDPKDENSQQGLQRLSDQK
jgi:tetratricopeptide (TPR) repeat protein